MATFNLTAQLNLRGPSNVKQIAAQIKKDLGSLNANVQFKLDPAASKNVSALSSSLKVLNANFASTVKSANAATAAIKAFSNSVNSVKINNVPQQINQTSSAIAKLNKASSSTSSGLQNAATEMQEFGKQAGLAVRRFVAFSAVTSVIYGVTNSINNGIQAFIDYDKELVKLQQVTGESAAGLSKLQSQITNLAVEFGVSSKELTQVASTLAQAGLSARETEKALKALALSSLAPSFDNMNETVEGSIAIMRQFGISADDLEESLGAVNTVAARFAVESSDIITAVQRTGSVFATASKGVSEGKDALNEFISVFTSIRATTRESAETIATGLRTIFTRIQRGTTIDALKEFGVNLTDAQGKFVGAYKAVELLSKGLGKIDPRSLDFSRIVEELGGFRQIGKVIPLIQQFTVAQQALKVAQQGQGSLAKDAATAQLSLANQISKVREEFFSLFREIGQSKGFQSLIRGALSLTSGLIKVADAVKGILPALAVLAAFKGFKALTEFTTGFATGVKRGPDGKAQGGVIRKFARGGVVPGTGSGDTVPAMLEPGEFVIRKKAVETIGTDSLHKMNKYGGGGSIRAGRSKKRQRFAGGSKVKRGIIDNQFTEVTDVVDGDTIGGNVYTNMTFRFAGIDAPEKDQPYADMATNSLRRRGYGTLTQSITRTSGGKGRGIFKNDAIAEDMIKKGYAVPGSSESGETLYGNKFIPAAEIAKKKKTGLWSIPDHPKAILYNKNYQQKSFGGKIQKFAVGGKVTRNLGYIDFDIINDPANAKIIEEQIKKSGTKGPREYTKYLTDLAIKARKDTTIKKLTALYGVAGAGKSSIAMGRGANDSGRLRETNRFPILTPEDISKASEIMLLTSTVSKDKLDGALKEADKIYALSTTTQEEKDRIRKQRMMRDVSGVGLFGRKAGATTGVSTDSAKEEALLTDRFGSKAMILGRGSSGRLRRKRGDELVQITKKKLGFTWGGFSPTTAGHESIMDAAKAAGIPYEDFIALVGANEAIDPKDDSYRTAIFDQDFRLLLAKAGFGSRGATVLPKALGDMSVPLAFDMGARGGRRQITLPAAGSMAFVADKTDKQMAKYIEAGYGVTNLERTGGISGTRVRELLLSGNLDELQKVVSPGVFSLLKNNLPQLQNRSNIIPSLIQQSQDLYKQQVASIDEQLAATGITRADNKKAAIDPDYAAQLEIYQYLKEQKKKLATKASFEPYRLLQQLAEAEPDKYALKFDRTGQPSTTGLQEAILKKVAKETSVRKSSGILPAEGREILKRFGDERLPTDPSFGPFAGKTVRDTAEGGKLKYWNSAFRPETKADKLAYYTATRDYLIDKFNKSQVSKTATALKDTTNAVLSSTQLGLVGLNPLGYTGLLGPETWNLGVDPSGQARSINASIVQRGLPTEFQNVIDYLSGQTAGIVQGASKLLGITPKELTKKQRETLGQGNIEGALLEQIFGSADATILDDALRTRPIDFPMGIGPKAAKIFGIDPNIPTEVKRTIDSGSRDKAVEEFQRFFRAQYGIPDPEKAVQRFAKGGLAKRYEHIFGSQNAYGPMKEMVFDFDDTLVTGGEIRTASGQLDLSQKDNIPLVKEMLKKGRLTPLGRHLSEALKQEPSLLDSLSILSARNQNQAGILADTLSRLGLPIPASKIKGSDGPQNKKITNYQKMIDDNLETISRMKNEGKEAIHYKFAKGGKVEEEYKQILASILPKEMLTADGYLKMSSGQAEPIDFIPGRSLAEKSKSKMMSILFGKSEPAQPPEETTGAFYKGALKAKVLRYNIEKFKDKLPKDEYKALKQFADHLILFEGNDDVIKTAGGKHKGVLAHETFHDIQGYLYDNHPEIIDKLHASLLKRKNEVEKWYTDPQNSEWAGPKDYKLEHFFPTATSKSPYSGELITEAHDLTTKITKKEASPELFGVLGSAQWDFGRNELVPVLLSAAAERNSGAIKLLSEAFRESGLNPDFYKTLPKYALGGTVKDVWHGTTTGKDDKVLESFKAYGARSDVSEGFGQGKGFYVYSDINSAMLRAMELEGGANFLNAADPNGKPMALKFTELLNGKDWDLDYEFQNPDIVNFIHSHYDKVKEALVKSKGLNFGNFKDFSLDKKYDEYLDPSDNKTMRKVGISFKEKEKEAQSLLANNDLGDIRSAEVLSSLVRSLIHSDSDFYEDFENSFFADLKPKQGLKYVGKDPLKPVLAKVFERNKSIEETGWKTVPFAKGGSVEDTVPALLTPGEFVINKKSAQNIGYSKLEQLNKADKIQGYNKGGIVGGVQRFAFGGGVDSVLSGLQTITSYLGRTENITNNRPNQIDTSTIAVDPSILQDTKAFVDTLYDAGDGMKYLNRLLNENKQLSIKAVLEAGNKDLERLKISGASTDKIIAAEKALSNIRNKGLADVTKRQFLESGFKESSVGKKLGSGATQQKILALAEKEERRLIDKRKKAIEAEITSLSKQLNQPISKSDLADAVQAVISNELTGIKDKAFTRAVSASTGTKTSTGIRGNITENELNSLNITGSDVQKYIADSMRDRKTLRQMDQQLIAMRMEEYKNAGTVRGISVASAEEAKKLAQEEVSKRREAINDLAKMTGQRGVGAAGLMDTRNSPINRAFRERYFTGDWGKSMQRGLGDAALGIGLVAGQGQNISSALFDTKTDKGKIQAAGAGARIDKAATTLSVGLMTSAQLAAINPMLGAAAAIGTALYAGADAVFDFSGTAKKAAEEMTRALLNDKLSAASDNLSNALEKLSKDVNNVELRAKTASAIKSLTDTAIKSTAETEKAGRNKVENDRTWGDFFRGVLIGPEALAQSKKGSYGMEEARIDAQKEAENFQKIANAGYSDLERLYAKGFTNDQIMDPNNEAGNIVRESIKGMILADPEKRALYMASGPQGKEAIAGTAAQQAFLANDELAKASQEAARLARAMDLADKAGRRLAASFDKIADIVNESINRISFESDARTEAANQYASSLRGESRGSGPKLRERNILENPNGYSEAEFTAALESATAGLSDGLRKQLIGGAQLQQNIPKNITQSIATALNASAGAGVDELKKSAIDTAKNEIENNANLSRQQKDDLKQIATARIENIAKKAKDNNADNTTQVSEFTKELEDGTNILGDFGKKLLDSIKNLSSFKEGALDKFAKGLNEASKAAKEARNYFRKSREISNEGNMNLREVLSGYGETYDEKFNRIMGEVGALAGGETTVQGIKNRQIMLAEQRDALQKQQNTLTDPDALRNNVEQLNKLDDQLRDNREALDMLANSTELVDKAFNDLQHTAELQNNRQNFVNQLLTNTPEEADKLNQSFIRLQRNLSGGLNSAYNQRDARKAFNETLFKTGNVREATRAGNTVLANQRKETLALMQDPGFRAAQELQIRNQYAQGKGKPGVSADQAVAEYFQKQQLQVTKQMAIESGMINNPLVQQSLAALEDRQADPAMKQAAERYLEAIGLKAAATKAQGELALLESQSILKNSNDNLRTSIDDLRASIEGNLDNANIGMDAAGNRIVNPGVAVPAPPVARSAGGLIYASNGKLIDFKPKGTDTVPAMLSPGEFVINSKSTKKHLPLLESINAGYFDQGGIVSAFTKFDKNKNALLDRTEFSGYFNFDDFDLNKNDLIDMPEFESGVIGKEDLIRQILQMVGSNMVGEQIKYGRQQEYLSRLRPEFRQLQEEKLLRSGALYYPDGTSPRGKMFSMEGSRSTQNVADLILPPPYRNVPNITNTNDELLLPDPTRGGIISSASSSSSDPTRERGMRPLAELPPDFEVLPWSRNLSFLVNRAKTKARNGEYADISPDEMSALQELASNRANRGSLDALMTLQSIKRRSVVSSSDIEKYGESSPKYFTIEKKENGQPVIVNPSDYYKLDPFEKAQADAEYLALQKQYGVAHTSVWERGSVTVPFSYRGATSPREHIDDLILDELRLKGAIGLSSAEESLFNQLKKQQEHRLFQIEEAKQGRSSQSDISLDLMGDVASVYDDLKARVVANNLETQAQNQSAAVMMGQAEAPDFSGPTLVKGVENRPGVPDATKIMADEEQKKKNDTIAQERAARLKAYEEKKAAAKLREQVIRNYFGNDPEGKKQADAVIRDLPMWDKTTSGRAADYDTKFDADIIQMGLYRGKALAPWDRSDMISPDEAVYRYEAQRKTREDYARGKAAGDWDKFDPQTDPRVQGIADWLSGKGPKVRTAPIVLDMASIDYKPATSVKLDPISFRPVDYDETKLQKEISDLETELSWHKRSPSLSSRARPTEHITGLLEKKKGTLLAIEQTRTQALEDRARLNADTEKRYQELSKAADSSKLSASDQREYIQLSLQRGKPYSDIRAFPGDISSVETSMRREVFSEQEMKQWDARRKKEFDDDLAKEKSTTFYDKVAGELTAIASKNVENSVSKLTGNAQLGQAAGLVTGFGVGTLAATANPSTVAGGVAGAPFSAAGSLALQTAAGTTASAAAYQAGQTDAAIDVLKQTATSAAINLGLRALANPKTAELFKQAQKEFSDGIANPPSLREFLNDPEMRELGKALGYTDLLETVKTGQAVDTTSMFPRMEAAVKGVGNAIEKMPTGGAIRGGEYGFSGSINTPPQTNNIPSTATPQTTKAYGTDRTVQYPVSDDQYSAMGAAAKRLIEKTKASKVQKKASGGMIYASNGRLAIAEPSGTDTVPAMLTPGEFVVNAKATKKNLGLLHAINRSKGGKVNYLAEGGKPDEQNATSYSPTSEASANPYSDSILPAAEFFAPAQSNAADQAATNAAMSDRSIDVLGSRMEYDRGAAIANADMANMDLRTTQERLAADAGAFGLGAVEGGAQLGVASAVTYGTAALLTPTPLAPAIPLLAPLAGGVAGALTKIGTEAAYEGAGIKDTTDAIKAASPGAHFAGNMLPAAGLIASQGAAAFAGTIPDRLAAGSLNTATDIGTKAIMGENITLKDAAISFGTGAAIGSKGASRDVEALAQFGRREVGGVLGGEYGRGLQFTEADAARASANIESQFANMTDGNMATYTGTTGESGGRAWHLQPDAKVRATGKFGMTEHISEIPDASVKSFAGLAADEAPGRGGAAGHGGRAAYLDTKSELPIDYARKGFIQGKGDPSALVYPMESDVVKNAPNMFEPNAQRVQSMQNALLAGESPTIYGNIPGRSAPADTATPADVVNTFVAKELGPDPVFSDPAAEAARRTIAEQKLKDSIPSVTKLTHEQIDPRFISMRGEALAVDPSVLGKHTSIDLFEASRIKTSKPTLTDSGLNVANIPNEDTKQAKKYNLGGLIYANNGALIKESGTDNVPAMLTEGEFVINREASKKNMPILQAINSGYFNRGGIVNYLANGGIAGPQYLAAGGRSMASISNSNILPELLNKLSNTGMNSSGGAAQLAPLSNVAQTLKQTASAGGGVSNNVSIDTANIASSIQDAVTNAIGQFNEYTEQIGANFTERFDSAQKSLSSSINTFQTATSLFGEHASAIPTSLSANVTQTTSLHHIGLDSIKGNMEQKIYDNTSVKAENIAQDAFMRYDKTAFEGAMNTSAKPNIMGR